MFATGKAAEYIEGAEQYIEEVDKKFGIEYKITDLTEDEQIYLYRIIRGFERHESFRSYIAGCALAYFSLHERIEDFDQQSYKSSDLYNFIGDLQDLFERYRNKP